MSSLKLALSTLPILAFGLAACGAPPKEQAPQMSAMAATAEPAALAAVQLSDGTYTSDIEGKIATLVVRGGQPVAYSWGDYDAKAVTLDGNTINIDAAQLRVNPSGPDNIRGPFTHRGRTIQANLTKV